MFIRYNTEDGQVGDPSPSLIWPKLAVIGDADNRSEKPYEAACTSKRPPLTAAYIRSRMVDD